jgi:hypothetical protein
MSTTLANLIRKAIDGFDVLGPPLNQVAEERGVELLEASRRVRYALLNKGVSHRVEAQPLPDALGLWVFAGRIIVESACIIVASGNASKDGSSKGLDMANVCLFSNDAGLQPGFDVERGIPKTRVTPGGTEIESFGHEMKLYSPGN